MEEPPGKPLSCEEKEKLKEKLAFLKREYSKTLARLQRAQRAERAKNVAKKPPRDRGCCPHRLEAPPLRSRTEPKTNVSSCDTSQIHTHPDEETGAAGPNFSPGRGPVEGSHSQKTDSSQGPFICRGRGPGQRQSKLPGRWEEQQKRTSVSQETASSFDTKSLILSGKNPNKQKEINSENPFVTGTPETEIKTKISSPQLDIPDSGAQTTETNGRTVLIPGNAKSQSILDAALGENPFPGSPPSLSCASLDSRSSLCLQCEPPECHCELPAHGLKSISPPSPMSSGGRDRNRTVPVGGPEAIGAISASGWQPGSPDLEAGDTHSVNELICNQANENRDLQEQTHTDSSSESSSNPRDSRNGSLQENRILSQPGSFDAEAVSPISAENQARLCTVPEGLPFPAEYHVRTTRHMSNCQRRIEPEAVIQSHFCVSKKGVKRKNKEATEVLNLPGEETDQSVARVFGVCMGQAYSRIPFQRLLSAAEACSLSEGDLPSLVAAGLHSQRHRGRRKSVCSPASPHGPLRPVSGTSGVHGSPEEVTLHKGEEGRCHKGDPFARSALDNDALCTQTRENEMLSLKVLPSFLKVTDFQLPDEEFGPLKLDKLQSCSEKAVEPFGSKVYGERHSEEGPCVWEELAPKSVSVEMEDLGEGPEALPVGTCPPGQGSQPPPWGLSSSLLLLTPLHTASEDEDRPSTVGARSPVLPLVGTTPALGPQTHGVSADEVGLAGSPPRLSHGDPGDGQQCGSCTSVTSLDGSLHMSGGSRQPSCCSDPHAIPLPAEPLAWEESPLLGNRCLELGTHAAKQTEVAGALACDGLHPGSLQLVSKLQNPSGSCSVDVSGLWWETAGVREPCIVTACEYTASLWRRLGTWQWEMVCSWHFPEVPVLQIVPVPDICDLVCVALGNLEIREIRALLQFSEGTGGKQVLLRSGNIRAVLGLTGRRLVNSSGAQCEQHVEVLTLADDGGSKEKQCLVPPKEMVQTFAEVQGMQEALLGTTDMNNIVIWNLKTGQLLRKMHIGDSCPASVCHKAYAERGLLFVVLSHACAEEKEPSGSPVFQLLAINPKTARSVGLALCCLPRGQAGRFLEGDVKGHLAAAVLTSGAIVVWDVLMGHCMALLPPISDQSWSFVKWSGTGSHLLAGQKDGNIFVYLVS